MNTTLETAREFERRWKSKEIDTSIASTIDLLIPISHLTNLCDSVSIRPSTILEESVAHVVEVVVTFNVYLC